MLTFTVSFTHGRTALKFNAKPSYAVRTILKKCRLRWSPTEGIWWRRSEGCEAELVEWIGKQISGESCPVDPPEAQIDRFDMAYEDDCASRCGL